MTLYDKIIAIYPQLNNSEFNPDTGVITLQNNPDGS